MSNEMNDFYDKLEERYLDWDTDPDNRDVSSDTQVENTSEHTEQEYDSSFWANINNKGFLVYKNQDKYCLQKFSTPTDNRLMDVEEYKNMDEIAEKINDYLLLIRKKKYEANASYNNGLGPEFERCIIDASDEEEAKILALDIFRIKDVNMEIRIKFLNDI